jgi:small subunit ribosomal protein S18
MARNNQRGGSSTRRAPKDLGRRVKKKPCALCRDKVDWVDYKDVPMLRKYMSDRGKIRSRRVTGNCAQHQRALAQAIKTARELVLLPYTQRTVTERPGGRRDRGDRDRTLSDGFAGPAPTPVRVEVDVTDDTEAADGETEEAVMAEVEDLVEEMAEDAAADGDGSG